MNDNKLQNVSNIRQVFYVEVKKRATMITVIVLMAIIWDVSAIAVFGRAAPDDFTVLLVIVPWFIILSLGAVLYEKIRKAFWKELAKKYGWEYLASKDVTLEKGLVFNIGHSRTIHHLVSGQYENRPMQLFEYSYTVGSGKHQVTHELTVFEIKFTGTFPHLYLNHKGDWYSNPPYNRDVAKLPVPSEFDNKFELYSPAEYEIETLSIFTPDVFAKLLDFGWHHDSELVDGELIIYRKVRFNSFDDLDKELARIKQFIDIIGSSLDRAKLAPIGDTPYVFTRK